MSLFGPIIPATSAVIRVKKRESTKDGVGLGATTRFETACETSRFTGDNKLTTANCRF